MSLSTAYASDWKALNTQKYAACGCCSMRLLPGSFYRRLNLALQPSFAITLPMAVGLYHMINHTVFTS